MSVYCLEDLNICYYCPRNVPTGGYEITRRGTRRALTKYEHYVKTDGAGEFLECDWVDLMRKYIEVSRSSELFSRIVDHCKVHCAWLHTKKDTEEYAMRVFAGKSYYGSGWKELCLDGIIETKAFIFDFSKGW